MPNEQDIRQHHERLDAHRRRLAQLLGQVAILGISADARYQIEIEDIRVKIHNEKQILREWGEYVEDHPDDGDLVRMVGAAPPPARARRATPLGNRLPPSLRDTQLDRIGRLRELIEQIPEMRDAVVACHAGLRSVSDHMHELRGYKSLHDRLHTIQRQYYEQMRTAMRRIATDSDARDQLDTYISELEDIITELRGIVEKYAFLRETTLWLPRLSEIHAQIRAAFVAADVGRIESGLDQIGSILRVYPSRIHQRLSEAAGKMELARLIAGMRDIQDILTNMQPDQDIIGSLTDDLEGLSELTKLVNDHGIWQSVDALLDQIQNRLNQSDLSLLWDMLKTQAASLYTTRSDSWARFLRERTALLEQALRDQDASGFERHLLSYHTRAATQFYTVDKQLNELCHNLNGSDSALAMMRGVLS
jgi:hypothetical protein